MTTVYADLRDANCGIQVYKQTHDTGEPKPANWQAAGAAAGAIKRKTPRREARSLSFYGGGAGNLKSLAGAANIVQYAAILPI
jgi:hypothetical protein